MLHLIVFRFSSQYVLIDYLAGFKMSQSGTNVCKSRYLSSESVISIELACKLDCNNTALHECI